MIRRRSSFKSQRLKVEGRKSKVLIGDHAFDVANLRPRLWRGKLSAGDWATRTGFSLIELVVVIMLLGILVVLAVEKITSVSSLYAPLAADELRVNLRYIRNLAISRERATRVIFSIASNSYAVAIYDTNVPGNYAAAVNPVSQSPWVVDVDERFPGVALSNVNIGGSNTLYFNGTNGVPCYHTNTPLMANGTIVFNSGLTVTIVPDTGYVEWK